MLVDSEERAFESNTANATSAFTIAASSKAFQILSNQLYTDKPRAILRELSTNALDAHIANGCPERPFEVQLPTTWDSTLVVKDFGTGMSPEQIKSLYTTYFGSDKTHTNDLVGGLGLGSKSPFAYTDQFTAISRYNGVKYTYAAFIGAANVPEISLISTVDTDECNGFEVHVPVKESDIYTFERTAKRVFEFFEVKPILNQSIDFTIYAEPVMTVEFEGIESSLYSDQDNTMVMQGPIGYPVDYNAITSGMNYGQRNKVEAFFRHGWRIKAPIGSFEITASREALSYDKTTIARLLKLADGVLQRIKAETGTKLLAATTIKEAAALIEASSKYLTSDYTLKDSKWNGLVWTGRHFDADLPPNTKCRELRKRQYGRGNDPHQTDLHDDETIPLGGYNYRVYWSEKDRPFKAFVAKYPVLDKEERILYFTGPQPGLSTWLASVGLPPGEELPKAKKAPAGTGQRSINYGATKYEGRCFTSQATGLEATANDILDEKNAYIMILPTREDLYARGEEYATFKALNALDLPTAEIYGFYVPEHHSKVTKALKTHPGLITREQFFKIACEPKAKVIRKIALTEALTESYNSIAAYRNLDLILDSELLNCSGVIDLMKRVEAIKTSQTGSRNVHVIHNRLSAYDLHLKSTTYKNLAQKLMIGQTRELCIRWDMYKSVLERAIKGYESCGHHWRYKDSPLRTIVTEWVNTEVALLSTQQKVA